MPNIPMPRVVALTIANATMKTPMAEKIGLQRAPIQTRIGTNKTRAISTTHISCGMEVARPHSTAMAKRARTPSRRSRGGGGSRRAENNPMISGATVTIPIASAANQCSHIVGADAGEAWNNLKPATPPIPEMADATIAAAIRPKTRCNRSSVKGNLKNRWTRPAAMTASPALQTAKITALHRFRSPKTLAKIVAAATPATTGNLALAPRAMSTPDAMPAAGQKTATPSGSVSSARPSRAAKKYAMANAIVTPAAAPQDASG